MRLIPRRRPDRPATGTPPASPAYDPLGHVDAPQHDEEPTEVRIPIPGRGPGCELVIKAGNPFGSSTPNTEVPVDTATAKNEGARALAQAWYGAKP